MAAIMLHVECRGNAGSVWLFRHAGSTECVHHAHHRQYTPLTGVALGGILRYQDTDPDRANTTAKHLIYLFDKLLNIFQTHQSGVTQKFPRGSRPL